MTDKPMFEVVLAVPEIQRLLHLIHRDLARVEGNIVIAQRKLADHEAGSHISGSARQNAAKVLQSCPRQAEILEGAQGALQEAMSEARKKGVIR